MNVLRALSFRKTSVLSNVTSTFTLDQVWTTGQSWPVPH